MTRHCSAAAIGLAWLLMFAAGSASAAESRTPAQKQVRAAAGPATFRIVATDRGFEAPDRVPAGLRHIVFENHGSEIHEGMLVKLPQGMRAEDYVAAVKAGALFPEGAQDYSGAALTSPGETTELWTRVDAGNYIVICWNADHARTRGVHAFTVVARGAHEDQPPSVDAVLKLVDFRFELSQPLHKGVQVIRVETTGPSMHEADFYRLLDGKVLADLIEWRKQDGVGVAPAVALGGVLDSHDLSHQVWLRRNFAPGRYVLHCEMPMSADAQAGTHYATHADAGMVMAFEIAQWKGAGSRDARSRLRNSHPLRALKSMPVRVARVAATACVWCDTPGMAAVRGRARAASSIRRDRATRAGIGWHWATPAIAGRHRCMRVRTIRRRVVLLRIGQPRSGVALRRDVAVGSRNCTVAIGGKSVAARRHRRHPICLVRVARVAYGAASAICVTCVGAAAIVCRDAPGCHRRVCVC
jgi:hypothetical protein